ncbi:uncharacterized protein [Nicotiana sylvestris]|uniref:uncharacterized protein n=1 Tax=Nicotiana sylvestris TaxID=4096 RepID=UPI00388CA324
MIEKGHDTYLAYVRDVSIGTPSVDSVPVVLDFPDVFPADLLGMPPDRDIDFGIDLLPVTHPISIPPFRIASPDMKKLKDQLQEFLDKGFIQPSVSHWGSGSYTVYCDASRTGLGVVLVQDGRMSAYVSRKLKVPCEIYTDHRSLQHLFKQKDLNLRQRRWEHHYDDPHLLVLKDKVQHGDAKNVTIGNDRVLRMQGQIYVPNVYGLRELILEEAHSSRLAGVHLVFHVTLLRRYHSDPSHVLDFSSVKLDKDQSYVEEPVAILDRQVRKLRSKNIALVKVQWSGQPVEEAT